MYDIGYIEIRREKLVDTKVRENIVDVQLKKCFTDVLQDIRFESYGYFDADGDITNYKKVVEDTKGRIYTYVLDTGLKLSLLPVENLVMDKEKKALYLTTTEERCTLIMGIGKLPKREK